MISFNTGKVWRYALIAALFLTGVLVAGIVGIVSAEFINAPVQVAGGSMNVPYVAGAGISPPINAQIIANGYPADRLVCYQRDPSGTLICQRVSPVVTISTGGTLYSTRSGGLIQNAPYQSGGGSQQMNNPVFV